MLSKKFGARSIASVSIIHSSAMQSGHFNTMQSEDEAACRPARLQNSNIVAVGVVISLWRDFLCGRADL